MRLQVLVLSVAVMVYFGVTHLYLEFFYGDWGSWADWVSRFALGERPYRDFVHPYPPLSLWLYGTIARGLGADALSLWAISNAIAAVLIATYCLWLRTLLPRLALAPTAASALLLAISYSSIESETLASGMYSPAAPLGALILVCCAWLATQPSSLIVAAMTGATAGLAVLTKQDYWVPAGWLICFATFRWRRELRTVAILWLVPTIGIVTALWLLASDASWPVALEGFLGLNRAATMAGRAFPSWERLTLQLILTLGLATSLAACLVWFRVMSGWRVPLLCGLMTIACGAVYVVSALHHSSQASESIDGTVQALARVPHSYGPRSIAAVTLLISRLRIQGLPLLAAPLALGWLLARWRSHPDADLRNKVLFLLCLATAARSRRLFEHVDWFNFLFDVPALVLALQLAFPRAITEGHRAVRAITGALCIVGFVSLADWTFGPPLNFQPLSNLRWGRAEAVRTARGTVYLPERDAAAFRRIRELVDAVDPSGEAPVFATLQQGGWAYFLGRRNPTAMDNGFSVSGVDPDEVISTLLTMDPSPIVIDFDSRRRLGPKLPEPTFNWSGWEMTYQDRGFGFRDSVYYDRLLSNFEPVGSARGRTQSWTVYQRKQSRT